MEIIEKTQISANEASTTSQEVVVGLDAPQSTQEILNSSSNITFNVWQQFVQNWIDMQEFFQYATVAYHKKPEWASPNEVVGDVHCFKLRKFSQGESDAIPTLILPPFAGHYSTIADYSEKQSLVQHLMAYGLENVHSLDYHSANYEMKHYDIDNYLTELSILVDDLGGKVNLIGLCQGGWFGAIFTARFPQKVQTLTVAGGPIDTQVGCGFLENAVNTLPSSFYANLVRMGQGLMDGRLILMGFKSMKPFEHYWQKYLDLFKSVEGVNDELHLERFEYFEVWYENTLKLPGKWYKQVIEELFRNNKFVKGEFKALGKMVSPQNITCPVYLLGGERDDITLPEQVFGAEKYLGTPGEDIEKALAKAGHIGLFMGSKVLSQNWKEIANWILKYKNH